MALFIYTLLCLIMIFVHRNMYAKLRVGERHRFNKIQNNIANAYVKNAAWLGTDKYFLIGTLIIGFLTAVSWLGGAWTSGLILPIYWWHAKRTQALLWQQNMLGQAGVPA